MTGLKKVMEQHAVDNPLLDLVAIEGRLRTALVARLGVEVGLEAAAEAMAWAWEHRDRLDEMTNPTGYLYRVAQSRSRRFLRWRHERVHFPPEQASSRGPWIEPALPQALAALDPDQRTAVVLVHCFQWTYPEVAETLDVPLHTVRNRVHRGMTALRHELGVVPHDQ